MKELIIKDYVSNDTKSNATITDFSVDKLIIKGDTGIGGTTSILNIKDSTIIIISPLVGMIQGKELKREQHQMFIYQNSDDRWSIFEKKLNHGLNVILNTTPEQIIELKRLNERLYNKVMNIPFFVDEFQIYSESEYRKTLTKFYSILFDEHKAKTTLSTATPIFKNLDIPKHFLDRMETYLIKREAAREKHISISSINNYWNFIKENCEKGIKVVLHTNDERKIKNILNQDILPYKVQTLVGATLSTKLSQYKSKTIKELNDIELSKIDLDADVYILSTKYQIGFDIPFDCAVGIITDQSSEVDSKTINEIVQAYGRCRGLVIDAKLFYRNTQDLGIMINKEEKSISKIEYNEEYLSKIQENIKNINIALTFPRKQMIKSLKQYGFEVSEDEFDGEVTGNTVDIQSKLLNLMHQDPYIQHKQLKIVKNTIKGDDEEFNGFNQKALLLWATAYLYGETSSTYLLNQEGRVYSRILKRAKTFIDVNDLTYPELMSDLDKITKYRVSPSQIKQGIVDGALCKELSFKPGHTAYTEALRLTEDNMFQTAKHIINTLYVIDVVNEREFAPETERILNGFAIVSNILIEDYMKGVSKQLGVDIKQMVISKDYEGLKEITQDRLTANIKFGQVFNNSIRDIKKELSKYEYTQGEATQIVAKMDSIKNSLIKCKNGVYHTIRANNYSIDAQIDRHKFYLLGLLSLQVAGHMFGFKTKKIDNREFNVATKTTRQLRGYIPYQLKEIDIKAAFPSFLDEILETNISQDVYNNIMVAKGCTRDEAKIKYNSMLNDSYKSKYEAKSFYKICGYTEDKADKLASITTKDKGGFYRTMTVIEEKVINQYKHENRLDKAVRLHDALIVYNTPNHQLLSTKIGNYNFEIKQL